MDDSERSDLAAQVYRLHLDFLKRANDAVVFLTEITPLLKSARKAFVGSDSAKIRKYVVPSADGVRTSKRTHEQMQRIFDRYLSRDLAANFVVTAVSQFESYLFDVLRIVIRRYPDKLKLNANGQEIKDRQVSIDVILRAGTLDEARSEVIDHRIVAVSYSKPSDYLKYIKSIAGIDTDDDAFQRFVEIKATRDVIIHNNGVANEMYEEKVGNRKRAERGKALPVDSDYFEQAIATLKRCSNIISRDIDKTFPLKRAKLKAKR